MEDALCHVTFLSLQNDIFNNMVIHLAVSRKLISVPLFQRFSGTFADELLTNGFSSCQSVFIGSAP
jgi:hypothetical protein